MYPKTIYMSQGTLGNMNAVGETCNEVAKTVQMHVMSKTSMYYIHVYTKPQKCSDMDSRMQCIQQLLLLYFYYLLLLLHIQTLYP